MLSDCFDWCLGFFCDLLSNSIFSHVCVKYPYRINRINIIIKFICTSVLSVPCPLLMSHRRIRFTRRDSLIRPIITRHSLRMQLFFLFRGPRSKEFFGTRHGTSHHSSSERIEKSVWSVQGTLAFQFPAAQV